MTSIIPIPVDSYEVTPLSNMESVAVRIGRRLNELTCRLELAWLLVQRDEATRVLEIFEEVRLLSRGLSSDEQCRENWSAVINETRENWICRFGSQWHTENHQTLLNDVFQAEYENSPFSTVEVLSQASSSIAGVVSSIRQSLFAGISPRQQELLAFGYQLDQLRHPASPHRHLQVSHPYGPFRARWDNPDPPLHTKETLRLELDNAESRSVTDTISELRLRWRQLGFPDSSFPELQDSESVDEGISRLECLVPGLGGAEQPRAIEDEVQPYLGLTINGVEVTRLGCETPITVTRQVHLELIHAFLEKGAGFITLGDFEDVWAEMGRATPVRGTIDSELSHIRRCLEPLGLGITNVRNVGWRLVELETISLPE
ncbi:hypothetical protein AB1K70_24835 [Bremerella sp. JC770]|uniref:hypothetical protein n=1 Tax=Bremerella sp. JC770 TaxID=3232137 RepID=UPI00345A7D27